MLSYIDQSLLKVAQKLEKKRFAVLDALTLDASDSPPRSVLVVFHGYGATAEDLLSLAPSFAAVLPDTAQVFLQAPDTCDIGGIAMKHGLGRAWFPLSLLSYEEIVSGLRAVESSVAEALDAIATHYKVPCHRIALFGFSQGGMVALQAACHADRAWLAAVGIATRFVEPHDLQASASDKTTPLLMIHGDEDAVVPFEQGSNTASMLREQGYNIEWLARAGLGHSIDAVALQSACDFLARHRQQQLSEEGVL